MPRIIGGPIPAVLIVLATTVCCTAARSSNDTLKVLIVDGQNNHSHWPKTTVMLKHYLESTGNFEVDVARTAFTWKGEDLLDEYGLEGTTTQSTPMPQADPNFRPEFDRYDVVLSNFGYGAAPWPDETKAAFETWMKNGGGLVVVHAANNSFPDWAAWNEMIGVGGWGGRTERDGPWIYANDKGDLIRDPSAGRGGSHGQQHEFSVVVRDTDHPVTRGLPREWMHCKDELYDRLRGPALNLQLLATAWSDPATGGSGRHEPMMLTVRWGSGRIFHTPMGHADYSMECVGFISVLRRGTEWAATGEVTTPVPEDFPTADTVSARSFER